MNKDVKRVMMVDRSTGDSYTAGLFELIDDKELRQHPEPGHEDLLRGIADELVAINGNEAVYFDDDPRAWFDNLPQQYSGTYMRVCDVD